VLKISIGKEQNFIILKNMGNSMIEFIAIGISFILIVLLILIVGIMIPKFIGGKFANQFLKFCYPLIWFLMVIFTPITSLVTWSSKLVLKIFGMKDFEKTSDITEKGIISMVNEGQEMGVLEPSEAEMITNIFEYGDKDANDIMIRRKNIVAIESSMKMNDAIDFIANENYSRIPVFKDTIDNIIGILHLKDLMRFYKNHELHNKSLSEIDNIIRKVQFIPETRKIDDIFKMMQLTKEQMVIVIDEYGQTSGLIAMEDILEEIVGNIMDEYDEEEELEEKYSEDEFVVSGKTRLENLEEKLNISFEEEDFDTLNGYIISKLDRIPIEDEEFSFVLGQYIFKINHVENKMIHSVLIKKIKNMDVSKNKESEGK
jgi:putative hemolysin